MARTKRAVPIGPADLKPGERKIIEVDGKSVGLFNVNGVYYALHNRCPHMGGNLCAGPVTGTTLPTRKTEFVYGRRGELVRCGWHGWEFEIATGKCTVHPRMQAKRFEVTRDKDDKLFLMI